MTVEDHNPRWIALDGAVNARIVVPGVLLRADNLQSLSERDVRRLVEEEALEVVLDLRTDIEVRLEAQGRCISSAEFGSSTSRCTPTSRRAPISIRGRSDHGGAGRTRLPDEEPVVRAYMNYLRRRPDSVVGSARAIARSDGAVLVHCAAGKDRTGVVVAVALDAAGVERDTIVGDYLATRERIDAIMDRLISFTPPTATSSPEVTHGATRRSPARWSACSNSSTSASVAQQPG